jgi:P27 family predicted phage terminase small subunit
MRRMANRKPPEVHAKDGTRPKHKGTSLPTAVRDRVPVAEWLDNPDAWDKQTFIVETSAFLWDTYGIGSKMDRHVLAMLADQIDTYIECNRGLEGEDIVVSVNGGSSLGTHPLITIRDKTIVKIITLMNELGLTPRSRLTAKKEDGKPLAGFLKGPGNK